MGTGTRRYVTTVTCDMECGTSIEVTGGDSARTHNRGMSRALRISGWSEKTVGDEVLDVCPKCVGKDV